MLFQSLQAAGTSTLRGRVIDKTTKDALTGASLVVRGTGVGAAADLDGNYIIRNVPLGKQELVVSYVGYKQIVIQITTNENQVLERNFELEPETLVGQAIVITAQAQGQLAAINQQLTSNTIENVVSKARIKELPDVNAAESIGRLPGVSIQRSGGEATKVEIRGLSPKFNLVTVNGVELPAASASGSLISSGASLIQSTTDRSVDLSLVSSNMLDGITLKKSITPDMDADVLGGTVDLKLREASPGMQVNFAAQGGYNNLQKYYGNYSFMANVSNRYFDNKLGVIINGNIDNYDRSADKFQDDWFNYSRGGLIPDTIVTAHLYFKEEKTNRKRAGASILLDYEIPFGKVTANGFYNQLKTDGTNHIDHFYTPSASYNTNKRYYLLEEYKSTTNVFTSALALQQDFEWIRYDINVSRAGTLTDDPDHRTWQFNQEAGALQGNLYRPYMSPKDIAAISIVDTNNAYLANLYSYSTRLNQNTTSAKLNITVPFRIDDQITGYVRAGGKLKWIYRRNDQNQYGNQGLQYGGGGSALNKTFTYLNRLHPEWNIKYWVSQYGGLSMTPYVSGYTRDNFLDNDYPLGPVASSSILNQMTDALKAASKDSAMWVANSVGTFGSDYLGYEKYSAAYVMGEINYGDFVTLIPGVRFDEEYTSYDGERYRVLQSGQTVESPPGEYVTLSKVRRNTFLLPMINLIVKPTSWLQVRLSRTETIARPDYLQYAPISYINSDNTYITAANYSLKPSRSVNYDLSISVFNNEIGLFSISGFYKRISDLVFFSTFRLIGGITPDPELEIPTNWYKGSTPVVNTYRNNPNPAYYTGVELEWQTHFWYLPSVLKNLVLNVNYTYIYSEMKLAYDSLRSSISGVPPRRTYWFVPRDITTRMPDQPRHIINITIGYDWEGFSARASYLYQTDKLTGIGYDGVLPTSRLSSFQGAYGRWDLTLQQKIDKNFQVFANFNNLNNRHDQNLIGANLSNPSYIEYYGFTMDLGVRFNL